MFTYIYPQNLPNFLGIDIEHLGICTFGKNIHFTHTQNWTNSSPEKGPL